MLIRQGAMLGCQSRMPGSLDRGVGFLREKRTREVVGGGPFAFSFTFHPKAIHHRPLAMMKRLSLIFCPAPAVMPLSRAASLSSRVLPVEPGSWVEVDFQQDVLLVPGVHDNQSRFPGGGNGRTTDRQQLRQPEHSPPGRQFPNLDMISDGIRDKQGGKNLMLVVFH